MHSTRNFSTRCNPFSLETDKHLTLEILSSSGDMTSVGLDSTASFKSRALEIGMSEALCNLLRDNGVSTYGAFAFIVLTSRGRVTKQS